MAKSVQVICWGTSALLSARFSDSNGRTAQKWSGAKGVYFVSTLTFAEVSALIHRMQRERLIRLRRTSPPAADKGQIPRPLGRLKVSV
jgi:hypothetical protein